MLTALLAPIAVVAAVAAAPAPAQADVLAVERAWNIAVAQRDVATLDRVMADDFILLWADGTVATKAQILANTAASTWVIDPFETEEVVVRLYGEVAVVTGRFTQTAHMGERSVTNSFRYTDVYRRAGGTWVAVSAQATLIPKPAG